MLLALILCFALSLLFSLILVFFLSIKFNWMLDHDTQGIQKFHVKPVPRLGGLAMFIAMLPVLFVVKQELGIQLTLLFCTALPAFLGGIAEDITKKVSPLIRLLLTFCSAAIGFYLFDAQATRLGLDFTDDYLLTFTPVALVVTIFMVGGVSHSVNIIDGYNGLMLGLMLMLFGTMAYVSYDLGDTLMMELNLLVIAVIAGVFILNFPLGKIFSGDGGAYLLGYLAATVSLLMVQRNSHLSPWFALLLMILPIWETVFSIYRRKFIQRTSATEPDNLHLHSLIYRFLERYWFKPGLNHSWLNNALVGPCIWLFCLALNIIPVMFFWYHTKLLVSCIMLSILVYMLMYRVLYKAVTKGQAD